MYYEPLKCSLLAVFILMSCLRKRGKYERREKSALDFNAVITWSSFWVHIGGCGGVGGGGVEGGREELMKSSRGISQFHFTNFSTLYKDAAGVGSQEEFWVNIDPVNMCAVRTLPSLPFLSHSLLSERWRTLPAANTGAS